MMKTRNLIIIISLVLAISACDEYVGDDKYGDESGLFSMADGISSGGSSSEPSGNGDTTSYEPGLITAGEWNDLQNWEFWENLLNEQEFSEFPEYWDFNTTRRISVLLTYADAPVIDATVELKDGSKVLWSARTDNDGIAELWPGVFDSGDIPDLEDMAIWVNDSKIDRDVSLYEDEPIEIILSNSGSIRTNVELAFIVDATGSMSDELEFLKQDLLDVIEEVEDLNTENTFSTAAVFYRDEGDEYIVRESAFTNNLSKTIDFIADQSASGGGDFPEAVHTALKTGISQLQWSESARTRLVFLLLDAPPHHTDNIIGDLQDEIGKAAEKGIRIIPIVASGIDKETEFLMRFCAISTNGTYVFITDDSGIGNSHLVASVGDYEVEYLNELLVRLISEEIE